MDFYWFLLGVLSVWRITHLLAAEDGPWDALARLRRLAGDAMWGHLLDCFHCLSLWVAAPIAFLLGQRLVEGLLLWPALSAGAIFLEGVANSWPVHGPAKFIEDEEEPNGMLRKTAPTVLRRDADSGES